MDSAGVCAEFQHENACEGIYVVYQIQVAGNFPTTLHYHKISIKNSRSMINLK